MTEQVEKPQPVDNSHLDAGIAARTVKDESAKTEQQEVAADEAEEASHEEQNETEGSAASEADDAAAQRSKNKGVGKRIDELTKAREDAKRERDYWREQAMRNKPEPVQQEKQNVAQDDEPKVEDFEFDIGKYNRAWYEWRKGQDDKQQAEQKKAEAQRERQRKFVESASTFAESNPDFHDTINNPALPINEQMVEVISEADNPAAVAYYLAKNPQEAEKIAAMSPAGIGRAIGRIEATLTTEAPRQITPKTVTQAPPPVTTLSGSPASAKSYEDMSMEEYDRQRKKERAAKGLSP